METLLKDVRYGLRMWLEPGLHDCVCDCAGARYWSQRRNLQRLNGVLLRPLPFGDPTGS